MQYRFLGFEFRFSGLGVRCGSFCLVCWVVSHFCSNGHVLFCFTFYLTLRSTTFIVHNQLAGLWCWDIPYCSLLFCYHSFFFHLLKCHLRWVGAPPGNMHRPCKVLFDSAGAGGQDAECLFLFYSSNANANTKHSTLNLNRNSNKPQTQTQTSTFIPNSQTANCRVGTWMCLVIAMNAQEPRPPCVQRRVFLLQDALGKSQVYR